MRLFLGIPLADGPVHRLSEVVASLSTRNSSRIRWTAPESWHITLQFLGNTTSEQYRCVVARLQQLKLSPLRIDFEPLDAFERAKVFFAGIRITPPLIRAQQQVQSATQFCGFEGETRPYHPHITLARVKGAADILRDLKKRGQNLPPIEGFTAGEFLLYESFLGTEGARYEIRERFPLDSRQE